MKNNLSKKEILIIGIIIITIIGVIGYYIYTLTMQNDGYEQIQTVEETEAEIKPQEKEKIIIHIAGEVNNPGIVKMEEGARIADIIEAAGGITRKCKYTKRKFSIYCRRWTKNNYTKSKFRNTRIY